MLAVVGCGGAGVTAPADSGSTCSQRDGGVCEDSVGRDRALTCPTDKIAFTQQNGCMNDGSVEFCISNNDAALLSTVQTIAERVTCSSGAGRAGCTSSELLCFYPLEATECEAPHGALTDAVWTQLCELAALPEIRELVPTWFE